MSLLVNIREKARKLQRKVVLPEGDDQRVIEAASEIVKLGLARPIVIGSRTNIKRMAGDMGVSVEGVDIIDFSTVGNLDEYATEFAKLREKKGMTFEQAKDLMIKKPVFYAAMMVRKGAAHGVVSGAAAPTADVLRAGLQVIGAKPGVKTVSSVFIMELTERQDTYGEILLFGDCSVMPEPTAEQLADTAASSVETAKTMLGMDGKVALLSFSTKGSASHPSVDVVKEAGNILRERKVEFAFEDELQADAALVKSVASKKCPDSKVAGHANILIFPNLAAGNIGYKLVQRLAGANAYGPIIQGLAHPINDLSRGCSAADIVDVVAMTAIQE